jgi:hypothetical protein
MSQPIHGEKINTEKIEKQDSRANFKNFSFSRLYEYQFASKSRSRSARRKKTIDEANEKINSDNLSFIQDDLNNQGKIS